MTEKFFDIILFGVTGLVGRHGMRYLFEIISQKKLDIIWGVAGRNDEKIRTLLQKLHRETNDAKVLQIQVISADLLNPDSIKNMVRQTKVLLNSCGPLRKQGEILIQTCIKFGTHYLDISAEPNFIEKMQLEYDAAAQEAKIYIANSCGYDSLAYEMGVVFLMKNLNGILNSIETYLIYGSDKQGLPGPDGNTTTWKSIIDLLSNKGELRDIRKRRTDRWPELEPKLYPRIIPFKPKLDKSWAILSPSADLSVMRRTQQYMFIEKYARPIQIQSYFMFSNISDIIIFIIGGSLLHIFSKFQCGKTLLLKYPSLFSGGLFSTEEPFAEKLNNIWTSLTLVGKGWKDLKNRDHDTEIVARIKGYNTGYKLTSLCLILSGIVLLTEKNRLPKRTGVLTPGPLFSETTLIEQLHENGLEFKILKENTLKRNLVKNKL